MEREGGPPAAVEALYLSDPPPQAAAPTPCSIYLHQSKILTPGTFLSHPFMFSPSLGPKKLSEPRV